LVGRFCLCYNHQQHQQVLTLHYREPLSRFLELCAPIYENTSACLCATYVELNPRVLVISCCFVIKMMHTIYSRAVCSQFSYWWRFPVLCKPVLRNDTFDVISSSIVLIPIRTVFKSAAFDAIGSGSGSRPTTLKASHLAPNRLAESRCWGGWRQQDDVACAVDVLVLVITLREQQPPLPTVRPGQKP
jgi:hypothetical protein